MRIYNRPVFPYIKILSWLLDIGEQDKRNSIEAGMNNLKFLFLFYWSLGAEIAPLTINMTCWDQNSFQVRAFLSSC